MNVIKMACAYDISVAVADIFAKQIAEKPNCVLGFATGASPIETYKRLIEKYNNGEISFKDVSTFNLDEYVGLSRENKNSYFYFMKKNLFEKTDINFENVHFLSGESGDTELECSDYQKMIADKGGIDIQLLGVGTNGHIGFNEPSDHFKDGPFRVELTQSTINSNSKYFVNEEMPKYALTMGVGDILRARKILLIATGKSKAMAVRSMVKGKITPACPASALQKHPDVTIFIDDESAALLNE